MTNEIRPRTCRVLVVTGGASVGGMETAVAGLVAALQGHAFSFVALCPFESAFTARPRRCDVPVHVAPIGDRLSWTTIRLAATLIREYGIDVVHAHMAPAHAVAGLAGRATRTPVLATVHAMHVSMWDLEVHRLAATHVCVASDAARSHALAVGAEPARLCVIRNGVDGARFAPHAAARDDERAPTVGYVGRLSAEKNPQLFLRAAALIHASMPTTRFHIIGDGPMRADLEAMAKALRISEAVRFAGERDDMPAQFHQLDLMMATAWHEGTSLAVLEAMASGVAVVATDVGGTPELVAAGETGLLSPPGDEMAIARNALALLRDRAVRQRFGVAARERALRLFPIAAYVERTAMLLNAVAGAAPAARTSDVRTLRSPATVDAPAPT
jgi:glycosyltransferase involved in cell wall biosynthesis